MADTLGQRITKLRKGRDLTQDELAEKMGVSSQAVSKWENDISCPDVMMFPQLADFFGVTIDELMRGHPSEAVRVVPAEERDLNKVLLKIVVDSSNGDKVRVNLPFSLIKMGLEIGMQMPQISGNETLKNIDFQAIVQAVECGVSGNLIEVESADGDTVNIFVE